MNNRVTGCRAVESELGSFLAGAVRAAGRASFPDREAWLARIQALRRQWPDTQELADMPGINPNAFLHQVSAAASAGAASSYVSDVGQHQMWAAQFIDYENPGTWINSGGAGTMGFAVPAAMGAKVGCPDTTVWAIDGDGCFQMTNQELATCAIEGIGVKIAIINNGSLGMVRQWQTLFYNERYSNTDLHPSDASLPPVSTAGKLAGTRIPDFVKLAEAYGCEGIRCEEAGDVDKTIERAMEINDRPVVVDFIVHRDAMVWPMVAAGTSNNDIKFARGLAPDWGGSSDD
jgi:acetolactate synthase-1/2/3 large subunit